MALTRTKKEEVVSEISELLNLSKITVVANYEGTSVKQLQDLRKLARENGTKIKVIKNRLFKQAIEKNDSLKGVDTSVLNSQLMYAFNDVDEVAPAQSIAKFAKNTSSIKFVGAFTSEGEFIDAESIKAMASLPGKNQLIAEVVATLNSPIEDIVNSLSGGLNTILNAVEEKAA